MGILPGFFRSCGLRRTDLAVPSGHHRRLRHVRKIPVFRAYFGNVSGVRDERTAGPPGLLPSARYGGILMLANPSRRFRSNNPTRRGRVDKIRRPDVKLGAPA